MLLFRKRANTIRFSDKEQTNFKNFFVLTATERIGPEFRAQCGKRSQISETEVGKVKTLNIEIRVRTRAELSRFFAPFLPLPPPKRHVEGLKTSLFLYFLGGWGDGTTGSFLNISSFFSSARTDTRKLPRMSTIQSRVPDLVTNSRKCFQQVNWFHFSTLRDLRRTEKKSS